MARPPKKFHEFIGQRRVVDYLTRLIAGAKELGRVSLSLLLIAHNGAGKSTLARAIATEYGSELHAVLAGEDLRVTELCHLLLHLTYGDVLFIDEAHSLRRDAQQVLYEALDAHKVPALREDRIDRRQFQSIAAFTLILATNEPGSLKGGLLSRLHRIEFDPYSEAELKAIAEWVARQEDIEMTPQAARWLAKVAQGRPRSIYRRVEALRHLYPRVYGFTIDHIRDLLTREGIDDRGLSLNQRQYLLTLADSPQGACALERLASKLGCDAAYISREIEIYLIDQGWVDPRSPRGRALTASGRTLADILRSEGARGASEAQEPEASQC